MCLIIDANAATKLFAGKGDPARVPVLKWFEKAGRLVLGGKLTDELLLVGAFDEYLAELERQGRVARVPRADVEREGVVVSALKLCKSDDQHVLAIARLSKARTLCTFDDDLSDDFREPAIVPKIKNGPQARVYRSSSHGHLLDHSPGCPGPPPADA